MCEILAQTIACVQKNGQSYEIKNIVRQNEVALSHSLGICI